jgi:hypothetical protein
LKHRATFYKSDNQICGKVLDIAIREVNILSNQNGNKAIPKITSVALLFKNKVICKTYQPFNRKLHKLFIRNLSDSNNLALKVETHNGLHSTLPLPLPEHCVKNKKVDIDFAIDNNKGIIYSGKMVCTVSLNITGSNPKTEAATYLYSALTNDPNDPRNSFSLIQPKKDNYHKQVRYFLLQDPALCFPTSSLDVLQKQNLVSAYNIKKINFFFIIFISHFNDR